MDPSRQIVLSIVLVSIVRDILYLIIIPQFVTNLLTYSMVQSPSCEASWFAASQEIPRISRNPKVHYRTHKCSPPVSILAQPNPVHIPTSHLLEIHPNIIHPFTPRSPQWSPSLQFPHQDPIHPPLLTHMQRIVLSPEESSRMSVCTLLIFSFVSLLCAPPVMLHSATTCLR